MWNDEPAFCPKCGERLRTRRVEGRARPACASCPYVFYRMPASASAAVVLEGGAVLLVKRRNEPYRGAWTFPAGYQEVGETPAQTAIREAREETGIEVAVTRLLDVLYTRDDPRKPGNLAAFLCRPRGGRLRAGDDAEEVAYFPLQEVPREIGFRNNRILLQRVRREFGAGNGRRRAR